MAWHRSANKHGAGALTHHRTTHHHRTLDAAGKAAAKAAKKGKMPRKGGG